MKLKIAFAIAAVLVVAVSLVLAQPTNKQIVQMNNQTCPVSGQPTNEAHTYIYEGKEYNLCSEDCKQAISENPKKYLSK